MSAQCWKIVLNLIFIFNINNAIAFSFELSDLGIVHNLMQKYLQSKCNVSNPYKDLVAQVRNSSDLSDQELATIAKRLKINNEALADFLNIDFAQDLRIGFCASGGGYRSTICTLGSLQGAQDIGLLDCVTYMSGLSGSTWAMGLWLSSNKSLRHIQDQVKTNLNDNFELIEDRGFPVISNDEFSGVIRNLITKFLFDQKLSSVDLWGALIVDDLFEPIKNRHQLKLSDQAERIKHGNFPLPIYTAIHPISKLNYNWLEFTPFEVGNIENKSYIPTWSFGRKFENGQSLNNAPEQNLSFLMGVCGSAYDVTPQELMIKMGVEDQLNKYLKEKFYFIPKSLLNKIISIKKCLEHLLSKDINCQDYHNFRFVPGQISNFNYNMPDAISKDLENIVLVDAGIDFNLPFPPLLRPERKIDVIFALDASEIIKDAPELMGAQNYANKKGLKFPLINGQGVEKESLTIFGLEDYPSNPIIIYMPRVNPILNMNDDQIAELKTKVDSKYYASIEFLKTFDTEDCVEDKYCNTFNFSYEKKETELLSTMTYLNMVVNREAIADILKLALAKKHMPYFKMPSSNWICR